MKIAIDVDGVITAIPQFFSVISKALKAAGHEIHIVSNYDEHFRKTREKELANYGIEYNYFAITGDKIGYCKKNKIDFAIDDYPEDYYPKQKSTSIGIVKL